ncbi:MAG: DUF411 domain-containing protein [Paracoccus sp. (in: a-proteobacteria)]|uniref:DUF411 domain-containing protein n=1 Tax=Paracoccus sp. TaxID=267 RepID=UPI003918C0CB
MIRMTRRRVLLAAAASALPASALPAVAAADGPMAIHVVEGRGCECCMQWTAYLKESGFDVTSEQRFGTLLMQHKIDMGVPMSLTSCHTGTIDGYFLEGHVPVADIRRLLTEKPDALGLTVPGMPFGSPGMGPESRREAYDVLLVHKDGSSDVFNHYPAA